MTTHYLIHMHTSTVESLRARARGAHVYVCVWTEIAGRVQHLNPRWSLLTAPDITSIQSVSRRRDGYHIEGEEEKRERDALTSTRADIYIQT